ncbi:hypothetical protein phiAS5_ORF0191 [Aeromonas phage phiAS5]|uniref:Uncharacterized protein n=1 Tax=Aeromonas phage phiAS5 TaxID=879630 RepID=E1A2T8_9CAUD|nr:hypothetical protein phiAS5_ORF0191 [Aeromonas phage phiAS5]ADM80034.1 hypothetical protein phiAS5_ORF0191 [Aeromonas phage phiAS5]
MKKHNDKLVGILFLIKYGFAVMMEKVDFRLERLESYLVRKITERRIKRFRGFDSVNDVFESYMKNRESHNTEEIADELKSHIDSARLRKLLVMATKNK